MALPLGIGTSVGLSLGVSPRIRQFCLSTIDMIAGIPSVIVGFIGLAVVVPAIQSMFSLSTGESILSASLVLAFMVLPYIVTHCTDLSKLIASAMKKRLWALVYRRGIR